MKFSISWAFDNSEDKRVADVIDELKLRRPFSQSICNLELHEFLQGPARYESERHILWSKLQKLLTQILDIKPRLNVLTRHIYGLYPS